MIDRKLFLFYGRTFSPRPIAVLMGFFLLLLSAGGHAQDSEFEKWKQQQNQAFKDYQTAEDKAFIDFLRREWEAFQVFKGYVQDDKPKPASPPKVSNNLAVNPSFAAVGKAQTERIKRAAAVPGFYGHALSPMVFPVAQLPSLNKPNQNTLADVWSDISKVNHQSVLTKVKQLRQDYELGDWAVVKLLDYLLKPQFDDQNSRNCYMWYLLSKMGYDVKIGYSYTTVVLMIPVHHKVYGMKYSEIDGKAYYMLSAPNNEKVFSYSGNPVKGKEVFDFTLEHLIKSTSFDEKRRLDYSIGDRQFRFDLDYDAGVSAFLEAYPQIDLKGYFTIVPRDPAARSLHEQLKPYVENQPERDNLDFLIAFTQALFDYQTDDQQFGYEKYLVIEESLYYGTNDCEDRSIFLAWLIHDLLDLEVLVLDYPGHIALAVRSQLKPTDDFIEHQGRRFVIVDPTYIGASSGMAMPKFKNLTPEIISVGYANGG